MTLTDVMPQNREENLLIVCTMPYFLDKVNVTVLRALGAEVLKLSKQDQLSHGVAPCAKCYGLFFEFPSVSYTILVGKCCSQGLQHLH